MEYLFKLRCDAVDVQQALAEGLREEYGIEAVVEQVGLLESGGESKLVWLIATQDVECYGTSAAKTVDMVAIGYDDDGPLGSKYRVHGRVNRYCPNCGNDGNGQYCQGCGSAIRNSL